MRRLGYPYLLGSPGWADTSREMIMPDEVARRVAAPIDSLDDPRAIQILSTEHQSLVSSRSLAYNKAFTRGDMFLGFLSMSFVALALLAQAIPVDREYLLLAALVLAFDFVVGLTTYGRMIGANYEDYRSVYGMARIRHGSRASAAVLPRTFDKEDHVDHLGPAVPSLGV
jgi:hypothetical protein